jgi:hypothetical protein
MRNKTVLLVGGAIVLLLVIVFVAARVAGGPKARPGQPVPGTGTGVDETPPETDPVEGTGGHRAAPGATIDG